MTTFASAILLATLMSPATPDLGPLSTDSSYIFRRFTHPVPVLQAISDPYFNLYVALPNDRSRWKHYKEIFRTCADAGRLFEYLSDIVALEEKELTPELLLTKANVRVSIFSPRLLKSFARTVLSLRKHLRPSGENRGWGREQAVHCLRLNQIEVKNGKVYNALILIR